MLKLRGHLKIVRRKPGIWFFNLRFLIFLTITSFSLPAVLFAEPVVGVGELHHLLTDHLPKNLSPQSRKNLKVFELGIKVTNDGEEVSFLIPGFENFKCAQCHRPDRLAKKAAARLRHVLATLKKDFPDLKKIPLRQYIIQPYGDELLQPGQFAHTTFDTIRIFPGAVIIDEKVYGRATHLHETLHLTQSFIGRVNELEAYGINIRSNPQFLILKFPYFADVVKTFFIPEMDEILKTYLGRQIKEDLNVSSEAQMFLDPFDPATLAKIEAAIKKMSPLLAEVSHLNRKHPVEAAYLSDQTGVSSLMLDIAAAKHLSLPEISVEKSVRGKAENALAVQFGKTDNTRLGYIIDRKKEALMIMKHQTGPKDPAQRLAIYFHFIKKKFIKNGEVVLKVEDKEDFNNYVSRKIQDLEKMVNYEGMTAIEKKAGRRTIEAVKNSLPK